MYRAGCGHSSLSVASVPCGPLWFAGLGIGRVESYSLSNRYLGMNKGFEFWQKSSFGKTPKALPWWDRVLVHSCF